MLLLSNFCAGAERPSFAFYYGAKPPVAELRAFDRVVVEAEHLPSPPAAPPDSSLRATRWLAYLATGEVNGSRPYFRHLPESWFLGRNAAWGSRIIDQTKEGWPEFFLGRIAKPLWDAGYRGFFLDALDSYQAVIADSAGRAAQEEALAALIGRLKASYPGAEIVLNRGFEILPRVHGVVDAVAFESLFRGWDPPGRRYIEVPDEDRNLLLARARGIAKDYGLPVIAIDYVPPEQRDLARRTARRIEDLGLIPWVSVPELDILGVGAAEVQPRKLLMLYDGRDNPRLLETPIHRYADIMATHLGLVPEYRDLREGPPPHPLAGRYAGILCWLPSDGERFGNAIGKWLVSQAASGVKLVLWGEPPFPVDGPVAKALGLEAPSRRRGAPAARRRDSVAVASAEEVMRFELPPLPDPARFFPMRAAGGRTLLRAVSGGDTLDAAAYMPWGGYALSPFVLRDLPDGEHQRWVLQPLEFLAKALDLAPMPVPDLTTENGTRLLMVHVDGDGFANRSEWPPHLFAGEVLEKEILSRHGLATTFSVIEGEISPKGMYPQHSASLVPVARRIFAMPHVEIASHTYSHPFDWGRFAAGGPGARESHLDIKGFRFGAGQAEREVGGSIAYINRELAPPGKACKAILWSGNCDPDARTVGLAYAAGVANVNGGETIISDSHDSWTGIAPIGQEKDGHFQVYAPNQNENLYTGEWTGPFYGYENVIQTFRRTGSPIRFKPVNIYYHSYSGSKQASLAALKKVYAWAEAQDLFNLHLSEYFRKALDFRGMTLARADSGWEIASGGDLRELRIPASMGYPDLRRSRGIAGYNDAQGVRYVHMTGGRSSRLILRSAPPKGPWLWSANGRLTAWKWLAGNGGFRMTLEGRQDLAFTLAGPDGCRASLDGKPLQGEPAGTSPGRTSFRLAARKAEVEVACPP